MRQIIMPDSATKIIEKGMTLKPPNGRFLKTYSGKALGSIQLCFFQPGIQMDVDACNHGKERITFFTMNLHVM